MAHTCLHQGVGVTREKLASTSTPRTARSDPRPGAPDVRGDGPGPLPGPQHHPRPFQQRPRRRGPAAQARDAARCETWLLEKQKATETETVAVNSTDKNSHKKIMTSLPSSNKVDEDELSSEPLPEDGSDGLRISRRPSNIPQVDGARDKDLEESPEETKHTDEEKETQTDIFLKLYQDGGVLNSFLDILYDNPPPTVYHPV